MYTLRNWLALNAKNHRVRYKYSKGGFMRVFNLGKTVVWPKNGLKKKKSKTVEAVRRSKIYTYIIIIVIRIEEPR